MNVEKDAVTNLEIFKKKEKFVEDLSLFYPGLAEPKLKTEFTNLINQAADDL